jgi:hypothetical protein
MSVFGPSNIDVHVHLANADALHQIQTSLDTLLNNQVKIMASLDDVVAADTQLQTEVQQIVDLVTAEKQTIADLQAVIAAGGLSAADQAKVDQLLADLTATNAKISGALPTP